LTALKGRGFSRAASRINAFSTIEVLKRRGSSHAASRINAFSAIEVLKGRGSSLAVEGEKATPRKF
jgi:hypothetical protein